MYMGKFYSGDKFFGYPNHTVSRIIYITFELHSTIVIPEKNFNKCNIKVLPFLYLLQYLLYTIIEAL
jgi:hypothetical protein